MPTENFFVRVPPDSTGKRVRNRADLVLDYVAGTRAAGIGFVEGEIVTGAGSGFRGIVYQSTASTVGTVHILLTGSVETATAAEAIQTAVGSSTIATASGTGVAYYSQAALIAGGNDLGNLAHVDTQGSIKVRGQEGAFEMDAFGRLRTSEVTTLAEYLLTYDELPTMFSTDLTGSATSTYDNNIAGVVLATGVDSGARAERRSDLYHKYQTGVSHLIDMTVIIGDAGKTGVRRRWGYFDDNDGLFFELDTSILNVVQRSSTTGSPVDSSAVQTIWNRDTLDGSGNEGNPSGVLLDVTKDNIYWMDLQWLGAGKTRFGIMSPNGERIIAHEFRNANTLTSPYMKTASLPVSWEIENTAGAGSDSQMTVICTAVKTEGDFSPPEKHFTFVSVSTIQIVAAASTVPLFSMRPLQTLNTFDNRAWIFPERFDVFSDIATGDDVAVVVEVSRNPVLVSASFDQTVSTDSVVAIDISAISVSAVTGEIIAAGFVDANGPAQIDVNDVFHFDGEHLIRKADITATPDHYTIHARTIPTTGSADVLVMVKWREIQ